MEYIYSCEKFNSHNNGYVDFVIVDERKTISSPAYLHTFKDKASNEAYCVVSDNIGIPMPHLKMENKFIVGTSQGIYFFDVVSQKTECESLNSPCTTIVMSHNKIIVICECDIVIISLANKCVIAKFEFNDVITNYKIHYDYLRVYLMEGKEYKIDI